MGDWEAGFLARFGGVREALTEAKAAVGVAKEACSDAEEAIQASLDRLAKAAAEMPASLTGIRAKEPCTPCAKAAAEAARER